LPNESLSPLVFSKAYIGYQRNCEELVSRAIFIKLGQQMGARNGARESIFLIMRDNYENFNHGFLVIGAKLQCLIYKMICMPKHTK